MNTNMQLEDFHLTRLHVDWLAPTKATVQVDQIKTSFDYDVAVHAKEKHRYKLDLRIRLAEQGKEQKDVGFLIAADIVGLFSFPEESDLMTREKLVRINGVSVLYSTLRGILGGITGMFEGNRLALPTIMPNEVVQRVEDAKRKKLSGKKETKAPVPARN